MAIIGNSDVVYDVALSDSHAFMLAERLVADRSVVMPAGSVPDADDAYSRFYDLPKTAVEVLPVKMIRERAAH
jgi:hypothetical protein